MSGSPSPSSRPLPRHGHTTAQSQWASQQHDESLQIRVVPYSPPRGSPSRPDLGTNQGHDIHIHPASIPDADADADTAQEPWSKPGVSASTRPFSSLTTPSSAHSFDNEDCDYATMSSRASSPGPLASRRSKRVISIHSDNKTFSLHPQSATESSPSSRADSFGSPQISSTTPSSSWGRVSSNVFLTEDRSSSPFTPQAGRRFSSSSSSSPATQQLPFNSTRPNASSAAARSTSPAAPSPWNYRMRGGVRKVDKTPDSKGKHPAIAPESPEQDVDTLPPLLEVTDDARHATMQTAPQLSTKDSFQTETSESDSTLSERTNYKVYGESSPVRPPGRHTTSEIEESLPPSSSHSNANYHILGESSSESQSVSDLPRPPTNDSDANYVVFGGPSASCSSLGTNKSRLRSEYSRESLRVAPLRPVKQRRSFERSGVFKSGSRESLRRGSLTSLGAALTQEAARSLFAGPSSAYTSGRSQRQGSHSYHSPDETDDTPYPHQWSRPLSTVMSESEGASLSPTRSASAFSGFSIGDRRSSAHSRNLLSMTSSLVGLDEQVAALGPSENVSLQSPAATYQRAFNRDPSGKRPVTDLDEERDGLGDLQDLHHRPSWTRLANVPSDRTLRSSGSTRSLNPFSLPTWARVYYGGGDRRFIIAQASSESMRSLYNGSMYNDPPYTNFLRHSPSAERFNATIRNPRRRPRDALPDMDPYEAAAASIATKPVNIDPRPSPPPSRMRSIARGVRKQTSSIWSPHLRRDRRASKFSMWDPPSAVWSTETRFDWRRNQQVVLFVLGFMVPFGENAPCWLKLDMRLLTQTISLDARGLSPPSSQTPC